MHARSRVAATLAATALALVAPAGAQAAESFYGVTQSNRLVTFNSDSPGATRASVPITGLLEDENIVGIDVRPADGALYGVGSASRLYKIDATTGRATAITPTLFDIFVRGQSVGVDFDPVAEKLRLVTEADQNLRIDPASGQVVDGRPDQAGLQPDADLTYAAGDPGGAGGGNPHVGAVAYTNSHPGAAGTQLFGIDTVADTLVLQSPPNDGVLHTVGRLGVAAEEPVGFDVSGEGRAYAAFRRAGKRDVGLVELNLFSGHAKRVTRRNGIGTYLRRRRDPIRALAAAGTVANDSVPPRFRFRRLGSTTVPDLLRGRALRVALRCSEACRATGTLLMGRRVVARGTASVLGQAGKATLRLRLSRRARRLVRLAAPKALRIRVAAVDAAGNRSSSR